MQGPDQAGGRPAQRSSVALAAPGVTATHPTPASRIMLTVAGIIMEREAALEQRLRRSGGLMCWWAIRGSSQ